MSQVHDLLKTAAASWKTDPKGCLRLLKEARNAAKTPEEICACEFDLLVYGEWHARILGGLSPYHSLDTSDLGFRFVDPGSYIASANALGGDQAGYAAFVAGATRTAQKIWSQSQGFCQNFICERLDAPSDQAWAEVETLADGSHAQAWLSCDGKYFSAFGDVLLKSLHDNGVLAHVHIMDPTPEAIKAVGKISPHAGLSVEYPNADRLYYHAARFKRFIDMPHLGTCWFLDVDAICNKPLPDDFTDIAIRLRPARIEPWNQLNACMIGVKTGGKPYMRAVADWLSARRDNWFWGIDQMALYCVWRAMEKKPEIRCLTPKECDYDYQDDGVIWCNSGAGKFGADPSRPVYYNRFKAIKASLAPPIAHPASLEEALHVIDVAVAESKIKDVPQPPDLRPRKIEKFIYLPVEIKQRELASKAQLAGEMAQRGFDVIIGASWSLSVQRYGDLPPGIVLHKTANALDAQQIFQCGTSGHINAILNEELFAMPADEDLYRVNCDPWALHLADAVFAHGKQSAELLKKLCRTPGKVRITGAPRASERHGGNPDGHILLCTASATINSLVNYRDYIDISLKTYGRKPDAAIHKLLREVVTHEWIHREGMLAIARILKESYPTRFRFRPHPAEDKSQYAEFADCMDEGQSFSEALRNAACVIFTSGCGTGLEAFNAGVPCVRYGEGGTGLSREVGLPISCEIPQAILYALEVGGGIGQLANHFAENRVADALQSLYNRHAYSMPYFDLADCWAKRELQFEPADFHLRKFSETSVDEMTRLVGRPVEQLGWNVFLVRKSRGSGLVSNRASAA